MAMDDTIKHLDDDAWRRLLANPGEAQDALAHLAEGCERCDAFVLARVPALDGEVDRALLHLVSHSAKGVDDLTWARLRHRLRATPAPRRRWPLAMGLAAAMVLSVTSVLVGSRAHDELSASHVKGRSTGPTLELAVAVRDGEGRFQRLEDGARVTPNAVLVFRAESSVEGPARVYLQRGAGDPQEIGETEVRAGQHEVRTETGVLGVSLDGERGEVTVWIVAGEGPFTQAAAAAAMRSGGTSALAAGRVHVNVE